jgi:hypothetical protein
MKFTFKQIVEGIVIVPTVIIGSIILVCIRVFCLLIKKIIKWLKN